MLLAMQLPMYRIAFPALIAILAASCSSSMDSSSSGDQVCHDAIQVINDCTGKTPEFPAEGCIGDNRVAAEHVVEGGCEALSNAKADDGACTGMWAWLGVCDTQPLSEAGAVASIADVCPSDRTDAVCNALRDGDTAGARTAVKSALAANHQNAIEDDATRLFIRERVVSLLAYNGLTEQGAQSAPANYGAAATDFLDEHFPAYEGVADTFPLARTLEPPVDGQQCESTSAIVFFPGVVRLMDRLEFAQQSAAMTAALPCLRTIIVNTGSFVAPSVNAAQAKDAILALEAEVGPLDLHLVGYSQGAANVLQTLATLPEIASKTRTVLTMNGASHGSEVANMLSDLLASRAEAGTFCEDLLPLSRLTCEAIAKNSPEPGPILMNVLAMSMGIPVEQLQAWILAESEINSAPSNLTDFFDAHAPGVASLTTKEASAFWTDYGTSLPTDILYTSFRSVISDTSANLPLSNKLFHSLLERAGGDIPYNDMQVRLENQSLGGPVGGVEIVMPVAEGNHWQWELATGAVNEATMPADMTDRIPHRALLTAYVQALYEVGLLD